jgi:alpha-D-ribose 1-methylphosphonate 5-triphosphate synthase subunit PhnH
MMTSMGLALDPVRDTQAIFRTLLESMAWPGRIHHVPVEAHGAPGNAWAAAVLIALLDHETSLAADEATQRFVGARTGARSALASEADFVLADETIRLRELRMGSLEFPDDSATLVLLVDELTKRGRVHLTGPGIETERSLHISDVRAELWQERAQMERLYPRGIDLLAIDKAGKLAAIPRSTHVRVS